MTMFKQYLLKQYWQCTVLTVLETQFLVQQYFLVQHIIINYKKNLHRYGKVKSGKISSKITDNIPE